MKGQIVRKMYLQGLALSKARLWTEAIATYSELFEMDPTSLSAFGDRGFAYRESGQFDNAVADFSKAIELRPQIKIYWLARAYTYSSMMKEYAKAIADYTKVIEIDPKDYVAWNNRGIAHRNLGELDKAEADFTSSLEKNPKYALAWNNRGLSREKQGQWAGAIEDYLKALELEPNNSFRINHLAWLFIACPEASVRDSGQAVAWAKKAVELEPRNSNYWHTLGTAHYRNGAWQPALVALEKAQNLHSGGNCNDWLFLAMTHWQLDQKAEARKMYDLAIAWMAANESRVNFFHGLAVRQRKGT